MNNYDKIKNNLNLLSVFTLIYGILSVLFAFVPLIYVFMGAMVTQIDELDPNMKDAEAAMAMGGIFIVIGLIGFLICLGHAILNFMTYSGLKHYKWHTLCLVTAGINCLFMPFGTVLGVFQFINLLNDDARILFNPSSAQMYSNSTPPVSSS